MNAVMARHYDNPSDNSDDHQLPPPAKKQPCARCGGRKYVWNSTIRGDIRCPHCNRKPTNRPRETVEALNAVEARRVARASRMIAAAVSLAMRETRNPAMIADPKIRTVDRIMQRWAVGHGSGLPPEDPGSLPARVPALDDVTETIIDDVVSKQLPPNARRLICAWYRTEIPCVVLARQRGITPRALYNIWEADLFFLRELFLKTEHSDLLELLQERSL